jgi:hypothetical protein
MTDDQSLSHHITLTDLFVARFGSPSSSASSSPSPPSEKPSLQVIEVVALHTIGTVSVMAGQPRASQRVEDEVMHTPSPHPHLSMPYSSGKLSLSNSPAMTATLSLSNAQ